MKAMANKITEEPDFEIIDAEEIELIYPDPISSQRPASGGKAALFIKKLWAILQNEENNNIISWNEDGDAFIIHNQIQFLSKILPKYFKHNNLASFVRQLNLYDFHKTQTIEKNNLQFSHPFFIKAMPQFLDLIKRKGAGSKPSPTKAVASPSELQAIMKMIKQIKAKNESIHKDVNKIRQENMALWSEVNNLRIKYSKQSKIVNKLIHFLIAYVQKHHNSTRNSTRTPDGRIETGPKIMELDYRYKNNPLEFWTDFDKSSNQPSEQENYTVVEPSEDSSSTKQQENVNPHSPMEELFLDNVQLDENPSSTLSFQNPTTNFDTSKPSTSNSNDAALQPAGNSKDFVLDNSQFDLNVGIKELLKCIPEEEWTSFYKFYNENSKHDEDLDLELPSQTDVDILGKELSTSMATDNGLITNDVLLTPNFSREESMDFGLPATINVDRTKEQQNDANSFNSDDILFDLDLE